MRMMRALEPLGQQMQVMIVTTQRLERLHGRQHVVPIDPRASVPLAHKMELPVKTQTPGILRMPPVHAEGQSAHASLRLSPNRDRSPSLEVDLGDLLARTEIVDRGCAGAGGNPKCHAATRTAPVEPQHQTGFLGGSTVDERIHAQGAMQPDTTSGRTFQEFKTWPPHQRAIAEHPEVFGVVTF